MPCTVYALLVGIDTYPSPIRSLSGCVNDIRRIETLLRERVGNDEGQFAVLTLTNADATRQKVIASFRQHLCQAGPDDVALFYYSGHGSQEQAPPAFWHLEPDRLNETLVCYDSRGEGSWDLADKELALLISEVYQNKPHMVIILDCCHSGSGTRDAYTDMVRRVPTDHRQRPLESFIVTAEQATTLSTRDATQLVTVTDWFTLPQARYVVFSACRADEEAKEYSLGGERRGVFSYYLTEALQRINTTFTYRDVFKRADALVRNNVARQSPQIEATHIPDLDLPFLGGTLQAHQPYFTISYGRKQGWVLDGGAIHGIPPVSERETTILALFSSSTETEQLSSLAPALGEARVTSVLPSSSKVEICLFGGSTPDTSDTYRAIVIALPLPPLTISFEGDEQALNRVRTELASSGPEGKPSLLICEGETSAALRLQATHQRYRITRVADTYPLVIDINGWTEGHAQEVVKNLEHIAHWIRVAELANPAPSRIAPGAVRMDIFPGEQTQQEMPFSEGRKIGLTYEYRDGQWQAPQFRLRLQNTSKRKLYCMLFDLPETYGVFPILPGGGLWLEPDQEAWALDGQTLSASVPDYLWRQGLIELKDTLKLVVCTEECDATLLYQDDLDITLTRSGSKAPQELSYPSTLNRLMHRVHMRHITQTQSTDAYVDWITSEISISTVRPLEARPLPSPTQVVSLEAGVSLEGHRQLRADARLTTVAQAGSDLGNLVLPPLLRDNPNISLPFQFAQGRGGEPGYSILELTDVTDYMVVTPTQPLIIHAAASLTGDEHLLPIGYDGEFFLPLGYAVRQDDGVKIILERLPAPTSCGTRDLKGSIRILFQKVISQHLGLPFPYPLLAVASISDDGGVMYTADPSLVRGKVKTASRILLYLHGIIGDTRAMVASSFPRHIGPDVSSPSLVDHYDLILTFDYENIHTAIEEIARTLKARLEDVGLPAGHDKTLHMVGHSMGGLVARWFIEQEGGNQIVQRLVMLGAPNAGSPWPTLQTWVTTTLSIGLNSLAAVAWPTTILGGLVSMVEAVDVTLDQMQPASPFLQMLEKSPDPGILYTILAGNTSLIAPAQTDGEQSLFNRLYTRLFPQGILHHVAELAFFKQPNDLAVSVQSSKSIPAERIPHPQIREIPCDHLTYFSTEVGLRNLIEALLI